VIVGHVGLAGAVRGMAPKASLLWLLPAAVGPDLLDVGYAIAGVCNPYGLYSHTIPAVVLLAAVVGGAALLTANRATALACALVVLLHPALDYVTGNKLVWPGGDLVGLGWYDRPGLDFVLEVALLTGGWLIARSTFAPSRRWLAAAGVVALIGVQGAMAAIYRPAGWKPSACAGSLEALGVRRLAGRGALVAPARRGHVCPSGRAGAHSPRSGRPSCS
jgi:hypothetical protein